MKMGLVESNPVLGTIQPDAGKPRERVLSDDELAGIWRACGDDEYGRIIRLLILLAARRGEIGGLRWSELDLERATWSLPASREQERQGAHVTADGDGARYHPADSAHGEPRPTVWPARARLHVVGARQASRSMRARA